MRNKLDEYTNRTGGAYGVDTYGCLIGMHYGFNNHNHYRAYDNIKLSKKLRDKGVEPVILDEYSIKQNRHRVNKILDKNYQDNIAGNLQARNYHQVSSSNTVYCFSKKTSDTTISGGTNTALQLAIELGNEAYVFDATTFEWWYYDMEQWKLIPCESPILDKQYAIVGTRDVEDYHVKDKRTGMWVSRPQYLGKEVENKVVKAIAKLYENTLKSIEGNYE